MTSFAVTRSAVIEADPARVYDLVADFRQWPAWSPWEGSDPDLERTYSGSDSGVGAAYCWSGNRRAGAGSMTITSAGPERIAIALTFTRPFRAVNDVVFALEPTASGSTQVVWTMTGERRGLMGVLSRVVPVDRLIGRDFERGLSHLDAAARA